MTSHLSAFTMTDQAALTAKQIRVLNALDPDYPQRLCVLSGDQAPKRLYVWGNEALWYSPAVSVCGSRQVSEKGLAVTADTVAQLVQRGYVIVSGHARGVDHIAHLTALQQGGNTIIVAAEGILSFRLRADLKKLASPDRVLILSEFSPNASWHVGRAMTRNRTILALSDAMILVESRLEGGTFNAGQDALRYQIPLFVAHYEHAHEANAGNTYFINQGAIKVGKSPETGRANLDKLIAAVEQRRSMR
ncbi:MAG: DNA-protecting protein DprA [Anaerolineae bacterium]|jgi:DNA processing protein|nr:DNA-protecting protein DprA [Anaerolineae bacterium]